MIAQTRLRITVPAAFANSIGIGVANLGLIFVVKNHFGADPFTIGWFGSTFSLSYFVACLAIPRIACRLSPLASTVLASALCAVSVGLMLASDNLALSFMLNAAYGASTALFWPPLMGWFSEGLEGKELSKATAAFSFSWSSGAVLSPWLAGAVAEAAGDFAAVALGAAAFAINGSWLAFALAKSKAGLFRSSERAQQARDGSQSATRAPSGTPLRFPAWVGVFAVYAFSGLFVNIFPGYAQDELGYSKDAIGLLLLARAAATTVGFWFFGRFHFWHFRSRYLVITGIALAALAFALTPLGSASALPEPARFIAWGAGLLALGALYASAYNASIFYGVAGCADRDRRMTIHEAMLTSGQIIGSLVAGAAYGGLTMEGALLAIAVALVASFITQAFMLTRSKEERRAKPD